MARLCKRVKTKEREVVINKYRALRAELRNKTKNVKLSQEERDEARRKLVALPRMSMENRLNTRCEITGRCKAVYRKFKLARSTFRELANRGMIPGITKASW